MEELNAGIQTMEHCADALCNWLSHNGLALNPSTSQVILFIIDHARYTKNVTAINTGAPIALSSFTKNKGVIFDSQLTFEDRVAAVSKTCYLQIRSLRHIPVFLSDNVVNMIACCILSYFSGLALRSSYRNVRSKLL